MVALRKERFSLLKFGSILLTTAGCLVLVVYDNLADGGDDKSQGTNPLVGNILLILNVITYCILLIAQKPLVDVMDPSFVSFLLFVYSGPAFVVMTAYRYYVVGNVLLEPLYGANSVLVWVTLVYIAVLSTAVAWPAQALAIKHASATIVSAFAPAQPLVAFVISILVLAVVPTYSQIAGSVVIILGLWCYLCSESKCENDESKALISGDVAK